jgi:HlyD family secretion protein
MTTGRSITVSLMVAGVFAAGAAYALTHYSATFPRAMMPVAVPPRPIWVATAPGRVEPKGGEVRLSALASGRIAEIPVRIGDRVRSGELLVALDDDDLRARLMATDAEVALRRRDRDQETVGNLAQARRASEDAVASAERALINQRLELDRLVKQQRANNASVTEEAVAAQRNAVAAAAQRVEQDRATHRRNQTAAGAPQPTRLETAVTAARAEVQLAEAAWERSRLRAPLDGTILQVQARVGELAAASPEQPLIAMGDVSSLRVRAEVEERDLAKVRTGQAVVVRTDAYSDREFSGHVASLAQSLSAGRIVQRGPKRPNDHDTLEVMIDMEAGTPLLPGMRVDVLFKGEQADRSAAAPTAAAR